MSVEAKQVYEWIKTGHWSLREFKDWLAEAAVAEQHKKHEVSQEPVAIVHQNNTTVTLSWASVEAAHNAKPGLLYNHPPQRSEDTQSKREPLTLGQKQRLWSKIGEKPTLKDRVNAFGLEIEAAHGINAPLKEDT